MWRCKFVKRLVILGVLLFALSLALAPTSSAKWYDSDDRATISIVSATLDFDYTINDDSETTYGKNVYLPCDYVELVGMTDPVISITSTDSGGLTYSIVVNGDTIVLNGIIAGTNTHTKSAQDVADGLTDNTSTNLVIEITANNTNNEIELKFNGDDLPVSSTWIDLAEITQEDDGDVPSVGGIWSVRDNITVTNTLGYDITDVDIHIDYPSSVVSDNPTEWINDTSVANGVTETGYVEYQKYGPANDLDEDDVTATNGNIVINLDSDDELDEAEWEIDFDDEVWDGAFDDIDYDTLTIEINGDEVDEDDWEQGSLLIENINIDEGENEIEFTWTTTGGTGGGTTTPDEEEPFTEQEIAPGVPTWTVLAIAGIIVIAIIAVFAIEKK